MFKRVSSIRKLDGLTLSDRDKENVEKGARELSYDMIVANFKSQKKHLDFSENPKKAENEETKEDLKEGEIESEADTMGIALRPAWEQQIEELVLNHQ